MTELSQEQQAAFDRVEEFLAAKKSSKKFIVVNGLAGSGKSHLLGAIGRAHPNAVMVAAFARAALNLSRRTGLPASTVHSAIYSFRGEDDDGRLKFDRSVEDGDWHGRIVLLDEHSTFTAKMAHDMLATGCKIVACGDPGQLKPVGGEPFFTSPDITLTEIHRQAWNSPIIRQAHNMRHNGVYHDDGEDFRVTRYCSADDVLDADVIITWRNTTRRALNGLKRAYLGLSSKPPQAGEPIVALRNDHNARIVNGATYELLEDHVPGCNFIRVKNENGVVVRLLEASIEDFDQPRGENPDVQPHPFALAYALTCHKMIGSSARRVLLVDEHARDMEDYRNWAYTGISRAEKSLLVKI